MELEFLLELLIGMKPMEVRDSGGMALLTPRERDVVRLAAEGMRNQEFALQAQFERTHRAKLFVRIFDKLGISSRVELALNALSGAEDIENVPVASATRPTGRITNRRIPTCETYAL